MKTRILASPILEHAKIPNDVYISIPRHGRPKFSFMPHYHPESEMLAVSEGINGTVRIGSRLHTLHNDAFFYIPPNSVHAYDLKMQPGKVAYIVLVNPEFILDVFRHFSCLQRDSAASFVHKFYVADHDRANDLYHNLSRLSCRLGSKSVTHTDTVVTSTAEDVHLLFEVIATILRDKTRVNISAGREPHSIRRAVRAMHECWDQPCSIDSIAERAAISSSYLCHSFRKYLGITASAFLNQIRIHHAQAMLRQGTATITDVAFACGFNSSSYFGKVFRTYTGISPKEWKMRVRLNTDYAE